MQVCELCGREVAAILRHHLIPCARHKKKRTKRQFNRQEMKNRIAKICLSCSFHIHEN